MAEPLASWQNFAFKGKGANRGDTIRLLPTVRNETEQERNFLVVALLGKKGVWWGTEPAMALYSYPGGVDAAATGKFDFKPGEEHQCPLDFTVPVQAPPKLYDVWVMVFDGEERIASEQFTGLAGIAIV